VALLGVLNLDPYGPRMPYCMRLGGFLNQTIPSSLYRPSFGVVLVLLDRYTPLLAACWDLSIEEFERIQSLT